MTAERSPRHAPVHDHGHDGCADDTDHPHQHGGDGHRGDGHGADERSSVTDVTPLRVDAARVSVAARPLIGLVHAYQYVAAGRPSPCRHVPSCSTYAVEALQIHGAAKGSWLAVRRLARCQPWGTQGYDPVPDRKAS